MKKSEMRALYAKAKAAGLAAGEAAVPVPMVVKNDDVMVNGRGLEGGPWFVPEGACGFAWVKIRPGNCPFANFLKKEGIVRGAAYDGGVDIWIGEFNQSVARKEACAYKMAEILAAAGLNASANSRLD